MTSSVMDGVGRAMVGVWRAHTTLDESDGPDSSPEAPDRFRKLRSSSSLNSLRMSLRKRLPLRAVQANSLPEDASCEPAKEPPKTGAIRKLTRTARNSVGGALQRFQRSREFSRDQCLVATPGRICEGDECTSPAYRTPRRTPRSATARTPGSRGKRTPDAGVRGVKHSGGRRQLVRMAALRSPFASPNVQNQRLKFDQDLESVSSGLRRLKHLSRAFEELIGRDDKCKTMAKRSGSTATVMVMRKLDPSGKLSSSNLSRRASRVSERIGSLALAIRK
ncbi:uncharacterized protein LOC130906768 [Corythoichthys intestinalis]|uniref:uncharacterized protein LOC130906768 n=1 Tax=Corythoichthys intestinalis TaxID=161448 RepID=UPI0025A5EAFD|nr:uncharacterized protein LOC130906768 [Corythoichthys intestinalis]